MKTGGELLLNADEFRLIEGLRLAPRRITSGRVRGERLTRKKGISIEFADFRDYVDGDDVRHLDWNVLARMEAPVIRTYQDEEDIAVHILLDCSQSMDFGEPKKLETAKRLASAIAYIALCGGDAVYLHAIGATHAESRVHRGRAQFPKVSAWLRDRRPGEGRTLQQSMRTFAASKSRSGLVYLFSDCLDVHMAEAVAQVSARGHEVSVVQLLTPEELDPDIEGDLRLLDSENNSSVEITATGEAINEYKRNLTHHCEKLATTCLRYGGRFQLVSNEMNFSDFVKNHLRKGGWVS
jgi:uncharacterized protein (DUF58 family)